MENRFYRKSYADIRKEQVAMIGIRIDANDKIAMGHLMRCMSIAIQLKNKNQDIVFIISEDYAGNYIFEKGFRYICLNNRYDEKDQETECLIRIIKHEKIDRLLIDSYEVTYEYMRRLREICKIIYIDDLNRFRYPADLIINYIYGTDELLYRSKGYTEEQFLLGNSFVPLRPEFSKDKIVIKKDISAIFLSTGGTDKFNLIISLLKKLERSPLKNTVKHVVTGRFFNNMEELEHMCQQDCTIHMYHDVQDICDIMHKCDLAISAGGTTISELCACGVPIICVSIADNQLPGIKAYEENGVLLYAGDIRNDREAVLNQVIDMALLLKDNFVLRKNLGNNGNKIIDGKGAIRIAEYIISKI